jgi:DNA-directed RNA polymerase subunit RPC12/RpoP
MQLTKEETEAASAVEVTQLEMQHHGCKGTFRLDDALHPIVRCNRCGERRQVTGVWVMTKEVK